MRERVRDSEKEILMDIQAQAYILWCSVDIESNNIYHLIYEEFQKKIRSQQ